MSNAPRRAGRHYLQIPGPTPVPDRILRAMDMPVIDHRGPEFKTLGLQGARRHQDHLQDGEPGVHLSRLRHRRVGGGPRQHALARRQGAHVRDRPLRRRCGRAWRRSSACSPSSSPRTGAPAPTPAAIEAKLREDKGHTIKAVCVVHNETSTGAVSPIGEVRRAIDAARHPALFMVDTISSLASIDYRHDEWGVDVTVGGSQKGLMLPPGLGFNAVSEKALAAAKAGKTPKSYFSWEEMLPANKEGFFPYTPATNLLYGLAEAIDMLHEEGLAARLRPPRPPRRGRAPRDPCLGSRDLVQGAKALLLLAHRHSDARRAQRRCLPQGRARSLRRVARHRPLQGRRQGVPHRPPRRHQRPHA